MVPPEGLEVGQEGKALGMTASTGDVLAFFVPHPWSTEKWTKEVKAKIAPLVRKCFPNRTSFQIFRDGEKLLHGQAAKEAMKDPNITTLPCWPKHPLDLNPQDVCLAWAEDKRRKHESPMTRMRRSRLG